MGAERDPASLKTQLRRRFDAYRRGLADDEYERRSIAVTRRLQDLPEVLSARSVHVYWPIVTQREIDTRPFIRWLETSGKDIVLPLVADFGEPSDGAPRLDHVRYPGEAELRLNRWGIAEPPPGDTVRADDVDVVVVPALGAGRNGHRIGHGRGYYDEFLASVSAPTVGLVFDQCLIDEVPAEPHDVPLDVIVAETEILRPKSL